MRRSALLAMLLVALPSPVFGQDIVAPLLQRLESVDPSRFTPADCDTQVAKAHDLNAMDLFYSSRICFAAKKHLEANFLLTIGQVRSMPDMGLMEPATEADKSKAAGLYGLIFYYTGGAGDEQVYRDPAQRERFFKMFDEWSATYGPQYDPGWKVAKRPDAKLYQQAVEQSKSHRRKQLTAIARAYSDDRYWSLYLQSQEIQKRNRVFTEGTPDEKHFSELQSEMDKRAKELGLDFTGN